MRRLFNNSYKVVDLKHLQQSNNNIEANMAVIPNSYNKYA